jgi:hypothetical protein
MLISFDDIQKILSSKNITIGGVFHLGAYECEELNFYNQLNIKDEDIIWIDANPSKVVEAQNRGIPNVYNAVITDKHDGEVLFNISNNGASSSILEFGTHSQEYPDVIYIDKLYQVTTTIDVFFEKNNIDSKKYDFWNFDIQGAELLALKGAVKSIQHAKALYLEVNEKELYKGCGLIGDIDNFLAEYNFIRVATNITQHGWGDALYVRN